jgi:fluoride exporter
MSFLAVGLGAALGAWLRWGLGLWLNALHPALPLGTLVANLGGGFLAGCAFAFFSSVSGLAPEWRLFILTGLLGGLTTFSTFSAEAMSLLQRGDYAWAFGHSAVHLLGSVVLCMAGTAAWRLMFD